MIEKTFLPYSLFPKSTASHSSCLHTSAQSGFLQSHKFIFVNSFYCFILHLKKKSNEPYTDVATSWAELSWERTFFSPVRWMSYGVSKVIAINLTFYLKFIYFLLFRLFWFLCSAFSWMLSSMCEKPTCTAENKYCADKTFLLILLKSFHI